MVPGFFAESYLGVACPRNSESFLTGPRRKGDGVTNRRDVRPSDGIYGASDGADTTGHDHHPPPPTTTYQHLLTPSTTYNHPNTYYRLPPPTNTQHHLAPHVNSNLKAYLSTGAQRRDTTTTHLYLPPPTNTY